MHDASGHTCMMHVCSHPSVLVDLKQLYTMAAASPQAVVLNTATWRNIKATITFDLENVAGVGTTFKSVDSYEILVETLQVYGALALKDKYTNLGLSPKCKVASIKYDDDGGDEHLDGCQLQGLSGEHNVYQKILSQRRRRIF